MSQSSSSTIAPKSWLARGVIVALLATFSVFWINGAVASAAETLVAGSDLASGSELASPNGQHILRMQTDGNLVLISAGAPRWNAGTGGNPGARLAMQTDGNLVVYATDNRPLWTPMTSGSNHRLVVQDDGNVVLYNAASQVAWQSGTRVVPATLAGGQTMNPGDVLQSPNGEHRLIMQTDGNLVLYRGPTVRWQSATSGSGHRLVMQADGNLVMYNPANAVAWQSGTRAPNSTPLLVVQDDGNVVLINNGAAAWFTGTRTVPSSLSAGGTLGSGDTLASGDSRRLLWMQTDGNLVLYKDGTAVWQAGTSGAGNRLVVQADGNMVIYTPSNAVAWQTGTRPADGAHLEVQGDGNVVLYDNKNAVLWNSQTRDGSTAGAPTPNPYGASTTNGNSLTPRANHVKGQVEAAFPGQFNCFTYRSSSTSSDHYTGNAIDCAPGQIGNRPTGLQKSYGDALAAWLVQYASSLKVKYVIWSGQIWQPSNGWRPYCHSQLSQAQCNTGGTTTNADIIRLQHYDHVHISVS